MTKMVLQQCLIVAFICVTCNPVTSTGLARSSHNEIETDNEKIEHDLLERIREAKELDEAAARANIQSKILRLKASKAKALARIAFAKERALKQVSEKQPFNSDTNKREKAEDHHSNSIAPGKLDEQTKETVNEPYEIPVTAAELERLKMMHRYLQAKKLRNEMLRTYHHNQMSSDNTQYGNGRQFYDHDYFESPYNLYNIPKYAMDEYPTY